MERVWKEGGGGEGGCNINVWGDVCIGFEY